MDFGFFGTLDFWILGNACMLDFGYVRFYRSLRGGFAPRTPPLIYYFSSSHPYTQKSTPAASQPVSQAASKLPGSWVLAARRNFQAQASKFNITGIQSEATTTAATKWPSSGAWTVAEFSTFELGRPCGPAKPKR